MSSFVFWCVFCNPIRMRDTYITIIKMKEYPHGSWGRTTRGWARGDRPDGMPHRATRRADARASVVVAIVRVGTVGTVGEDASSRVGVRGVEFGVEFVVGVVFAFAFVVGVVVVVGGRSAVDARGGDVRGRARGRRARECVVVECVDRFVVEFDAFVGFAVG